MADNNKKPTLLVTGASGGMGRACALLAAGKGYDLILSDLHSDKLAQLAKECVARGATTRCLPLDLADADAIRRFAAELGSTELDAIIHTAGLSPRMADWQKVVQVDLIAAVDLLEQLRPILLPGGCALAISSMSGHMVPPNPSLEQLLGQPLNPLLLQQLEEQQSQVLNIPGLGYAYAKRALTTWVKGTAMAWGKEGKRLVSLSPGLIDTPMGQLEAEGDPQGHLGRLGLVSLGREGQPREIAAAALFLVSPDASYISGCDLLVDGGCVGTLQTRQP
ncbi:SDR family oxidoreductase [Pseudomaricurvus sp. HS19]|uniref:SDR family oxidoreductase n=1 Tax=Pseudomaricurvus sp. HS19 TaxID=2692626 RepID=UPI001368EC68|nr:SDR family oxidoreductase [Pseudomaricurvus sp. HS19]MYM63122.1 SDR family oxidoreductase [Pseudomaricurvus sp. HS19]